MNRRVLVIGFGSCIRGDDAFGPLVVEQLSAQLTATRASDPIKIISEHLLAPELVEDIRLASLVLFVDAAQSGPAGELLCRRLEPDPQAALSMAHHLEPGGLLLWCQRVYQHVPEAYLLSTPGVSFEFAHAELSSAVATVVPRALAQLRALIGAHLGDISTSRSTLANPK